MFQITKKTKFIILLIGLLIGVTIPTYFSIENIPKFIGNLILIIFALELKSSIFLSIACTIFLWRNLGPKITNLLYEFSPTRPPSVEHVVGNASFIGYPKFIENQIFFISLITISILILILRRFLIKKKISKIEFYSNEFWPNKNIQMCNSDFIFIGSLFLIWAIISYPNTIQYLDSLGKIEHNLQWDAVNITVWKYCLFKNLIPYRDIFYPYAGQFYLQGPDPLSFFLMWLHQNILFLGLIIPIYLILNKRKFDLILILFFIGFLIETSYIHDSSRYFVHLVPILITISILALKKNNFTPWIYSVLTYVWVWLFEPNQLLYTSVGIISIIIMYKKNLSTRQLKFFLLSSTLAGLLIFAHLIFLHTNNQLTGFIDFYKNLGDFAKNASIVGDLQNWFSDKMDPQNVLMLLLAIAVGTIVFNYTNSHICLLLTGITTDMIMVSLKQIIRPHIAQQIIGEFILFFILFLLLIIQNTKSKIQILTFYLFIGLICSLTFQNDLFIKNVTEKLNYKLSNFLSEIATIQITSTEKEKIIEEYFSPSRFKIGQKRGNDLNEFINNKYGINTSIFSLGDLSYLYIIRNEKVPYYLTYYDGALISSQYKTLNYLQDKKPDLILWSKELLTFDGVPVIVKNPIVFEFVIKNYEYSDVFQNLKILKRKVTNLQLSDLNFWRTELGTSIDLGYLPFISSAVSTLDCDNKNEDKCSTFLKIKGKSKSHIFPGKKEIHFFIDKKKYVIHFSNHKKETEAFIYLNRIWFWNLANKLNLEIKIEEPLISDFNIEKIQKLIQPELLY